MPLFLESLLLHLLAFAAGLGVMWILFAHGGEEDAS
jgi:hypothetical protein